MKLRLSIAKSRCYSLAIFSAVHATTTFTLSCCILRVFLPAVRGTLLYIQSSKLISSVITTVIVRYSYYILFHSKHPSFLLSFRDTGCCCWPVCLEPGTHCLTIWEIRVLAETASANFWKYICSLCPETSSALEVLRECAIQIYLLTYLKLVFSRNSSRYRLHPTRSQC